MHNHTCTDNESRIIDWLDGTLAVDEVAALTRHVESCAHCDRVYRETQDLFEMLREDDLPLPSRSRLQAITASALAQSGQRRPRRSWAWAVAAMVALTLAGSWWGLSRETAPIPGRGGRDLAQQRSFDSQFYTQLSALRRSESETRLNWDQRANNVERLVVAELNALRQTGPDHTWDVDDLIDDLVPELEAMSPSELRRLELALNRAMKAGG